MNQTDNEILNLTEVNQTAEDAMHEALLPGNTRNLNPDVETADEISYRPQDYTDVGQAEVLAKHFSGILRYSQATRFICYRNHYWQESEPGAQGVVHELTSCQLKEATKMQEKAEQKMNSSGASVWLKNKGKNIAVQTMNEEMLSAYRESVAAKQYLAFAHQRRDSRYITAALREARPKLEIDPADLDSDPFILNTPAATYDLQKGMDGARTHDPEDLCTKITAVSPGTKGQQIWQDCLNKIFKQDQQLIDYVQMVCGLAAIGKLCKEAMIIVYGSGRNGKSTFWNAVSRVLGLYSGNISADTLTAGCNRNIKPEIAEIRGKRLLLAAEMQEGARLNDSIVKQLCSTDEVYAEKKYKDPFSFRPSHMLILFTNRLPRVSASDDGTWRRLIVVPFRAKLEGDGDIKNYADYLFENAGESVLAWVIEGARKVIEQNFDIPEPDCVKQATDEYRKANDWFAHFLADCCETDPNYEESSASLYQAYRCYCQKTDEYIHSKGDFYHAVEEAGFQRVMRIRKQYLRGLRLRAEDDDDGIFPDRRPA